MLIGIDLGTTVLKLAVFGARSGKLLASASRRLAVCAGSDGRREQDPAAIMRAMRSAMAEARRTVGGFHNVRGIGIAAQGGSMIIADRNTGEARTPMTLWNDMRALPEFHALATLRPVSYWRALAMRDEPGMGLARLRRMRRESPKLLDANTNIYAGAGEYLFFQLAGVWRQDAGNALQIGCYNAHHEVMDASAAKLAHAPLSFFAPLRRGHETHPLSAAAAKRFGLPAGIPVAGPYMDHEAGFASVSGVLDGPLQLSLGTAWVGNFEVPRTSTGGSPFQFVLPSLAREDRLVVLPLLTGNVTWDWALAQFVDTNHARALTKQAAIFAESLLPSSGLVCVPWLNRPNPLRPDAIGGCSMIGAGPSTANADLLRAVATGMCCELARVFEDVMRNNVARSVVLGGGASKGEHFKQRIAALFAPLPVYQVHDEDWMGARGTLHAFSSTVSAVRVKPVKCAAIDRKKLAAAQSLYQDAFQSLYGAVHAGQAFAMTRRGKKR